MRRTKIKLRLWKEGRKQKMERTYWYLRLGQMRCRMGICVDRRHGNTKHHHQPSAIGFLQVFWTKVDRLQSFRIQLFRRSRPANRKRLVDSEKIVPRSGQRLPLRSSQVNVLEGCGDEIQTDKVDWLQLDTIQPGLDADWCVCFWSTCYQNQSWLRYLPGLSKWNYQQFMLPWKQQKTR